MKLNFKLLNNTLDIDYNKPFLNVFILGNTVSLNYIISNFSSFNILDSFSKNLLVNQSLYLTKVLRSKSLFNSQLPKTFPSGTTRLGYGVHSGVIFSTTFDNKLIFTYKEL